MRTMSRDPDDAGHENPYNLTVCDDCERSYGPGMRCRCKDEERPYDEDDDED